VSSSFLRKLEEYLFHRRNLLLCLTAALTAVMAFFALQLRMDAGFEKQMPINHEYIRTFEKYKSDLFGANRITIVVKARSGQIWTKAGLGRLYHVTQAVTYLPNIDRLGVQSLWTPNVFVNEITEDGFRADPVINGQILPESLTSTKISAIRQSTTDGGYIGTLVSRDGNSAMITADLNETDRYGKTLNYVSFNRQLEALRAKYQDKEFQIEIIGFAKQIGDIADGANAVLVFCGIALLLTAAAVYWYCHSIRFTLLPIVCSLMSLIWQFGTLRLLGYGLDPLAVLVPFLVFSIGVSHGVQQVNFIIRELSLGATATEAARRSFGGLLIPGTLALVTAFVSFATLIVIPIPMVRELAITAAIGVGYKIMTNLVVLPVTASYFNFKEDYAIKVMRKRAARAKWLQWASYVARPRIAVLVLVCVAIIFGAAAWDSRDRVIGSLEAGAPELRDSSRFNQDAKDIANSYDMGLDWLSVVFEAPPGSCGNAGLYQVEDDFTWRMQHVDGVTSADSFTTQLRTYNVGYNEGNPKMAVVPIDSANLAALGAEIGRVRGYVTKDCSMSAVHLYLADHKATTINHVIEAVKEYRRTVQYPGLTIRLAAGNAGILAATNEEVARSELPMMLYVYLAIAILVLLAYREVRAIVICCLPLTVATFVGYAFMKELNIGLTVATLPVMVLAVGIGVDYAFYIYNRLQAHLAEGATIVNAVEKSIGEVGIATIFTAITLSIGVATWSFSTLKFQADMGKLLSFMFLVNLIMAMTALPALAVLIDLLFPRRQPVKASGLINH
jgi:uncharacterized protein